MSGIISSVEVSDSNYGLKDIEARQSITNLQEQVSELTSLVESLTTYIQQLDLDGNHAVVDKINGMSGNVLINLSSLGGAPIMHSSSGNTYGLGTLDKYGHVKTTNTYNEVTLNNNSQGIAASGYALQSAYNNLKSYIDNNLGVTSFNGETGDIIFTAEDLDGAPVMHSFATTKYGGGNSSAYGHVKISDDYNVTTPSQEESGASKSIAASSYAVQKAYKDLKDYVDGGVGVVSVNGETGEVVLTAEDIEAAPTEHANILPLYGKGNSNLFGHVKVSDDYSSSPSSTAKASEGIASSLYTAQKLNQNVSQLNDSLTTVANTVTALENEILTPIDDYDVENPSQQQSGASAHIVASGYAVQKTYEKVKENTNNINNLQDLVEELEIEFENNNYVSLSQAEYDALTEEEKENGTIYFIYDGLNSFSAEDVSYTPFESSFVQSDNVQDAIDDIINGMVAENISFTLNTSETSNITGDNVKEALLSLDNLKLNVFQGVANKDKLIQVDDEGNFALKTIQEIGAAPTISIGTEEPEDENIVLWIDTSEEQQEE